MKSKFSTLLLITFIAAFLSGCLKKGEDDPLISFRTRKARVVGNWTMTSGKRSYSYGGFFTETTYDKTNYYSQTNYDTNYPPRQESGSAKFTIKFNKDGTVNYQRFLGSQDEFGLFGTWNFTGGVGKHKNKEQIIFYDGRISNNITDFTFNIRELRNKKMVLYREMGNKPYYYTKEEFTFEQ
jgi:hypothetical protein